MTPATTDEADEQDHIYVVRIPGHGRRWTPDYKKAFELAVGYEYERFSNADDLVEARITIIHTRRSEYVLDMTANAEYLGETCMNRDYPCGHVAYGPPRRLPDDCPECEGGEAFYG
jgi:hypothetical protein